MSIIQDALRKAQRGSRDRGSLSGTIGTDNPPESVFLDAAAAAGRTRLVSGKKKAVKLSLSYLLLAAVIIAVSIVIFRTGKALYKYVVLLRAVDAVAAKPQPPEALTDKGVPVVKTDNLAQEPPVASPASLRIAADKELRSRFTLNGIMMLKDGPRAIVDNTIVCVGDSINGAVVKKIDKKYILLESDGNELALELR